MYKGGGQKLKDSDTLPYSGPKDHFEEFRWLNALALLNIFLFSLSLSCTIGAS